MESRLHKLSSCESGVNEIDNRGEPIVTSSAPRHHPRIDTELAAWYHVSDMPAYDNILSRRPLGRVCTNRAFGEHFEAGAHRVQRWPARWTRRCGGLI